jgi:hypothetical protein
MPSLTDQITSHDAQPQQSLTAEERAARFEQVCRDAASMESVRRAAGLPDPEPAPWPQSTWNFLAEQTRRARAVR